MAVATTERNRAPRGSRAITQAFFEALESIPEARRAEVAKAAQTAIRDELKTRIVKAKAVRAAEKTGKKTRTARKPAARKPAARMTKPRTTRRTASAAAHA